jgi:hypothetical protein
MSEVTAQQYGQIHVRTLFSHRIASNALQSEEEGSQEQDVCVLYL